MSLKVYYIDDEADLCENFADYFATKEIEVTTFTDPSQALDRAKINPPDIVFIDYRMPGTTGDEMAKLIAADIPKYLITGDIYVKTEYQFNGCFNKPYILEDIQQVLNGLLSN